MAAHDEFARQQVLGLLRPGEQVLSAGAMWVVAPIWARVLLNARLFFPAQGAYIGVATDQRLFMIRTQPTGLMSGVAMQNQGVSAIELSEVVAVQRISTAMLNTSGMRLIRKDGREWEVAWLNSCSDFEGQSQVAQQMYPWLEGQLAGPGFPAPTPGTGPAVAAMEVKPMVGRWLLRILAAFQLLLTTLYTPGSLFTRSPFGFFFGSLVWLLCCSFLVNEVVVWRRRSQGNAEPLSPITNARIRGGYLALCALVAFIAGVVYLVAVKPPPTNIREAMAEQLGVSPEEMQNPSPALLARMRSMNHYERRRMEREAQARLDAARYERGSSRWTGPLFLFCAFLYGPFVLVLLLFGFLEPAREKINAIGPAAKVMGWLTA